MTDITTKAIDRIAAQLIALKCTFRIDREGITLHDTLPSEPAAKQRAPRRRFKGTGIYDKLNSLQPGEIVRIEAPEGIPVGDVQSVLAARVVTLFGKSTCITQRVPDQNAVDVLRLE